MNKSISKKSIRTKLLPSYPQSRQIIGRHVKWQDEQLGSPQDQNEFVRSMADHPGLHSENGSRQNTALAMLQAYAILSSIEFSSASSLSTNSSKAVSAYQSYRKAVSNPLSSQKNITIAPLMPSSSSIDTGRERNNITKPSFANKTANIISLKKRSLSLAENIPYEIFTIMNDSHFNYQLRNTLNMIFRKAEKAPEVRNAPKQDKTLLLLLKCMQQMQLFVMQNNDSHNGKEMLAALIKIADNLDNPLHKKQVHQFKDKFLLKNAGISIATASSDDLIQGRNLTDGLIVFSPQDEARIIFKEQNRHINRLLEKNHLSFDKSQPLTRINRLIQYLAEGDNKNQLDAVAKSLLKPLADTHVTNENKMRAIAGYLNHELLGMSLDKWLIKKMQRKDLSQQKMFTNQHLKLWLNNLLNRQVQKGGLSPLAYTYYVDNVVKKLLPTLALQLTRDENNELSNLSITEPSWGFIHAGALLLIDSGAELFGLRLADIEDIGLTLNNMLREGTAPDEYVIYFTLPALLLYTRDIYIDDLSMLNEQEMQQVFQRYFEFIKFWEVKNNPMILFTHLAKAWKSRTDLAKELLHRHNISDEWVSIYLNSHSEMYFGSGKLVSPGLLDGNPFKEIRSQAPKITLPNIDQIFEKQNLEFANASYELDKLILPQAFDSLSKAEQDFIERARVDRVRIQFNARDSINKVPLSIYSIMGMERSGALIYHISERIDLLACSLKGEERIYALSTLKQTGEYTLERVDRDRESLLELLDDNSQVRGDPDYKIKVTSHLTLKKEEEPPQKIIEYLATLHKNKLLQRLYENGYDKTMREKVGDFFLSLLPFYTCITESIKGNEQEAIPACLTDIVSIIPFAGKSVQVGMRFSTVLAKSTTLALKYGARQAIFKTMIKQVGRELVHYSPIIAREISPEVMRELGSQLLRDLDPGIEILSSGGAKGVCVMENLLSRMTEKSPGTIKLAGALKKNIQNLPSLGAETLKLNPNNKKLELRGKSDKEVSEKRGGHVELKRKGEEIENISLWTNPFKDVVKRHISGSNYIQYYTKSKKNEKNSEVLVLSAHGGFFVSDSIAPAVTLPTDITIKMLTPHGTMLYDPGLENIVNAGKNFKAYVTITNGEVTNVDFLPQKGNSEWRYSDNFDPEHKFNTLGRHEGLQNYRHYRFHKENDKYIAKVLLKNRKLAKEGKAVLTDVLTVDSLNIKAKELSAEKASVRKILELDKEGKLLNENGERYKTIVFCHCRCSFKVPGKYLSSYFMEPAQLKTYGKTPTPKGSTTSEVTLTQLYRQDVNKEFEVKNYEMGVFVFIPIETDGRNVQSTPSLSLS